MAPHLSIAYRRMESLSCWVATPGDGKMGISALVPNLLDEFLA